MRLFLGIDLPAETKLALDEQLIPLKNMHPEFQWVDKENFHLTLYFFGETDKHREISARIKDLLFDAYEFELYSLNLDLFVKSRLLMYLSFRREKRLEYLVDKIQQDMQTEPQTKFIPHLTVSRSALSSKQQYFALKNKIEKMNIDISFPVKEIYLFESILSGRRPVYKKIEAFPLLQK